MSWETVCLRSLKPFIASLQPHKTFKISAGFSFPQLSGKNPRLPISWNLHMSQRKKWLQVARDLKFSPLEKFSHSCLLQFSNCLISLNEWIYMLYGICSCSWGKHWSASYYSILLRTGCSFLAFWIDILITWFLCFFVLVSLQILSWITLRSEQCKYFIPLAQVPKTGQVA